MALTQIDDRGLKTPIDLLDNEKIRFGTGNDLEIKHDGSDSWIVNATGALVIRGAGGSNHIHLEPKTDENGILIKPDGAVELYYDNSKKFETTSTGTKITGKSEIDGDVQWNGSDGSWGAFWDKSANIVSFKDGKKIGLGTSNDLQIYHDGTDSFITNDTGILNIKNDDIRFKTSGDETSLRAIANGAVKLMHNNSTKFETTSSGATVTGTLVADQVALMDNEKATFGDSNDLEIYHQGFNSKIADVGTGALILSGSVVKIENGASNETQAVFTEDGSVELYHNNVKKLETDANGINLHETTDKVIRFTGNIGEIGSLTGFQSTNTAGDTLVGFGIRASEIRFATGSAERLRITSGGNVSIPNDSGKFLAGAGNDLELFHDGTDSKIFNHTGTFKINANDFLFKDKNEGDTFAKFIHDGAVELYYDNSKKFETYAGGCQMGGDLSFADNQVANFGTGSDLQIKHDSANTYFTNSTGDLVFNSDSIRLRKQDGLEDYLKCIANGSVELYYNGTKHFETNSGGVKVNDNLYVGFGNGNDLQIKHDSTNGNNKIQFDQQLLFRPHGSGGSYENSAAFNPNGSVDLYYDDVKKLETTSLGTKSYGRLEAVSDGSSSNYTSPSAFLAYSSNSADEDAAEIFQGRYNRRCLTCSNAYDGSITQIAFESNDATCGTITCTNANATQYNTSSDYRLKENEVAISDGISRLKTLKPYRFNFKNKKDITVDGFFAHEVTAVPEAITGEKDGAEMQQIDQSKLVPLLVASLQEAIAKIETLETEVAALKG